MSYERVPLENFSTSVLASSTEISSVALNGHVVSVSDEFFAEASQLLEVAPAPSLKGQFGPKGALFSGWESRRHNPTFDWCIIKLGAPSGYIVGFDVDTSHFSGNEAPEVSVDACFIEHGGVPPKWDDSQWSELLPKVPLGPSSRHLFTIPQTEKPYTHVKLNMYPDGGIARFRVYGIVSPIFPADPNAELDLAHVLSGGRVVKVSDQHFGVGPNLLLPGRGKDMGDGWETKRSRTPGHNDWVVIRLGASGFLEQVEIDTIHFIGNYPESCEIHALNTSEVVPELTNESWKLVLPRVKLGPNRKHFFHLDAPKNEAFTHLKVTIFPDGGIKRIRVIGRRAISGNSEESGEPFVISESVSKDLPSLPSQPSSVSGPIIPAIPLTREAFAPFGDVIQAWASPHSAPKGTKVMIANQGTAFKFQTLSTSVSSYPPEAVTGPPRIAVYRCTPPAALAVPIPGQVDSFEVKMLERHKHTNQHFIPMGHGAVRSVEDDLLPAVGKAYLVVVAKNGPDDKPDLSTLRAFIASTSQGIAYNTAVWHHPMITLENTIDFACIETQTDIAGNILDCELVHLDPAAGIPVVKFSEL